MVKHTQAIRRQIVDELFECVWRFCEIGAKRVKKRRVNIAKILRATFYIEHLRSLLLILDYLSPFDQLILLSQRKVIRVVYPKGSYEL